MNKTLAIVFLIMLILGSSCSRLEKNEGDEDYISNQISDDPGEMTDMEGSIDNPDENIIENETGLEGPGPINESDSQDAEEVISKNRVKVVYPNGDVYEGEMKNGMMDGYGLYTYANGDIYEGEFKDNKPNGHGKLTSPNKFVYEGQMKNGMMDGY
ncbi:MAG TPA: hypothetical protein PLM18_02690, partial [Sedimentibacter sp.]|nr:hypothetical protein [Sedimentibacter sp.]